MGAVSPFRRVVGWLMVTLSLLVGVIPAAMADRDSSHYGGEVSASSFHAHEGDDLSHDHDSGQAGAKDHHDAFCTDHCCSDACAAALHPSLPPTTFLLTPFTASPLHAAGPAPAEERLIPPRFA